jgi:hypothetical protein
MANASHSLPASCASLARCRKPPIAFHATTWNLAGQRTGLTHWLPMWRLSLNAAAGTHMRSMWKITQTALVQQATLHTRLQAASREDCLGQLPQELSRQFSVLVCPTRLSAGWRRGTMILMFLAAVLSLSTCGTASAPMQHRLCWWCFGHWTAWSAWSLSNHSCCLHGLQHAG